MAHEDVMDPFLPVYERPYEQLWVPERFSTAVIKFLEDEGWALSEPFTMNGIVRKMILQPETGLQIVFNPKPPTFLLNPFDEICRLFDLQGDKTLRGHGADLIIGFITSKFPSFDPKDMRRHINLFKAGYNLQPKHVEKWKMQYGRFSHPQLEEDVVVEESETDTQSEEAEVAVENCKGSFSISTLYAATKSAVDMSEKALLAAEEALAAARIANAQAKAAFEAVDSYMGTGGIVKENGNLHLEEHRIQNAKCSNCKWSPCLHGKVLTKSYKKLPGVVVRAIGESWSSKQLGLVGKVISVNQSKQNTFLNVQWESQNKTENYTHFSKSGPKFVIECKLRPLFPELKQGNKTKMSSELNTAYNNSSKTCSLCHRDPCLNGKYLTEPRYVEVGMRLRSFGKSFPERYRDLAATVVSRKGDSIEVRWTSLGEVRSNTVLSKSGARFIVECLSGKSKSTKNSGQNTEDEKESFSVFSYPEEHYEHEDATDDDSFIMLASPSDGGNNIVDIDDPEEDRVLEGQERDSVDGIRMEALQITVSNPGNRNMDVINDILTHSNRYVHLLGTLQ